MEDKQTPHKKAWADVLIFMHEQNPNMKGVCVCMWGVGGTEATAGIESVYL